MNKQERNNRLESVAEMVYSVYPEDHRGHGNKVQLTPILLDRCREWDFRMYNGYTDRELEFKRTQCLAMQFFIDFFLQKLGWEEHTCDWDLGLVVETKDGKRYDSGQGYVEFEVYDSYIDIQHFQDDYDDDDEPITVSVNIVDINIMRIYS